ncbi:hypothetical protein ACFJIY_05770 [Pimelobacter simplex]|uniref:hypothetical protein n=1 Tax=Nocardioides simplex TaxID=2045 RepID=UPI003670E5AC
MNDLSKRVLVRGCLMAVVLAVPALLGSCGSPQDQRVATAQTSRAEGSAPASAQGRSRQDVLQAYVSAMQKYAECLRENGLPDLADPNQFGQITVTNETVPDQAAVHRAQVACEKLAVPMPSEVKELIDSDDAAALSAEQKRVYADYATCMQDNGAPDFPDPLPNGLPGDAAWDQLSAGAQRATGACASIIGDPVETGPGLG